MTALVTKHLSLVAGAPDGVKKLRALILELAVRGKLTKQISGEPTATALLDQISTKRSSGSVANAGRRIAAIAPSDEPYRLPSNWLWTRAEVISEVIVDCPHSTPKFVPNGVLCLDTNSVKQGSLVATRARYVDPETYKERVARLVPQPGDIVFAREGSVGESMVIPSGMVCCLGQRVMLFRPCVVSPDYFRLALSEPGALLRALELHKGIGAKHVNVADMRNAFIPLPPLAEQHRIVAKVDELMALCDRLEADQADAEAAHAQLVQALLGSLTQATDAADFRASWQRLSGHFHTLFTTEASIDALKQTVLQLAVMGKLVPQISKEESAQQLLTRIAQARFGSGHKVSRTKEHSSVEPFELPDGWCWTTFPDVGELARGKSKHRPRNDPALYSGGTIPLVQTGDVARANGVVHTHTGRYNDFGLAQSRLWPRGTMCITIAANIADSAILGFDACFPDSVVGFIPALQEIDVKYFEFFLRTAKADIQKFAPSTAQKNINLEILGSIRVPLPPAAEVSRIVAKVDELMALCDQLKAQLRQARQQHAQLADALVSQAVA